VATNRAPSVLDLLRRILAREELTPLLAEPAWRAYRVLARDEPLVAFQALAWAQTGEARFFAAEALAACGHRQAAALCLEGREPETARGLASFSRLMTTLGKAGIAADAAWRSMMLAPHAGFFREPPPGFRRRPAVAPPAIRRH
ncbi:MAG: hypothetical protein KDB53_17085, partial [Planctomycetes bacterium]|nr:hypothetical protein [Planctomycetota bacterium]